MSRSRDLRSICLDMKKRLTKKRKEKKEGSEPAYRRRMDNACGISRATGSCNLTPALPRTQANAYTPKAKRRSADIPAGTGSGFIRDFVTLPLFFSLLISINSAQQTELSATDVISPFRWRDRGSYIPGKCLTPALTRPPTPPPS